jgi:alkylhydroperoxidase/carboxymuconolactone decarboxylase family protein YurZ
VHSVAPAGPEPDEGDRHVPEHQERLRRLAVHDERFIARVLAMDVDNVEASRLDPKTHALVRLAALVAMDAATVSYQWDVDAALAAGATLDEIVGTLVAVAPIVGLARAVRAAPALALPVGYDVDAALEAFESDLE